MIASFTVVSFDMVFNIKGITSFIQKVLNDTLAEIVEKSSQWLNFNSGKYQEKTRGGEFFNSFAKKFLTTLLYQDWRSSK